MSPLQGRLARLAAGSVALMAGGSVLHAGVTVTVVQLHRAFSVAKLSLHRGDSAHFTNEDVFNHQVFVKAPDFAVDSPEQAPGDTVDVTFTKAGVFDVQCGIHPRMHLSVTVD